MHEIKFRLVFKHKDGTYAYDFITLDEIIRGEPTIQGIVISYKSKGYELTAKDQFTGHCDRNGKPIYEGDIVILNVLIEPIRFKGTYWIDEKFVVEFQTDVQGYLPKRLKESKLIGNIHENLELLGYGKKFT